VIAVREPLDVIEEIVAQPAGRVFGSEVSHPAAHETRECLESDQSAKAQRRERQFAPHQPFVHHAVDKAAQKDIHTRPGKSRQGKKDRRDEIMKMITAH